MYLCIERMIIACKIFEYIVSRTYVIISLNREDINKAPVGAASHQEVLRCLRC